MPYRPSPPLREWQGARRRVLDVLAGAATRGGLDRDVVAQAYVVRIVAEFQGFARDLHDFAAGRLGVLVVANAADVVHVVAAATSGRRLDSGNPGLQVLDDDFKRFGVSGIAKGTSGADGRTINQLLALRNAVAHGNARKRRDLAAEGVVATPAWTRQVRASLDRTAARLDLVTWNAMENTIGREPW